MVILEFDSLQILLHTIKDGSCYLTCLQGFFKSNKSFVFKTKRNGIENYIISLLLIYLLFMCWLMQLIIDIGYDVTS